MAGEDSVVILALDAGATNTTAAVVDGSGNLIWWGEGGSGSITRVGPEGAAGIVSSLWQRACKGREDLPGRLAAVAGGFAGGRSRAVQMDLARRILNIFAHPPCRGDLPLTLTHDAEIALTGAVGEDDPGCVVISGTGSICMVRDATGATTLAGGWGWPLGDEGSATWVGWMTVRRALESWEEGLPSALVGLVLDEWELEVEEASDPHGLMRASARAAHDIREYARLAPRVYDIAMDGDPDAASILTDTGIALGRLIRSGCRRLGMTPGEELRTSFMGSLGESWIADIEARVREGAGEYGGDLQICAPAMPAEGGAALLALKAAGIETGPEERRRLAEQLLSIDSAMGGGHTTREDRSEVDGTPVTD